MGVQGLATLLDSQPRIYRDTKFRKMRLVIDGCNLLYLMYFKSGLDQNRGGEYATFEDLIERFVKALRDCGIMPYVVLDGGSDHTDKKLETVTLRAESRIKKAHQAAVGGSNENILPQLAKIVFRQTLARLEVPMAQCFAEADPQIVALANEWQCPVLSNDSDFYIFNLSSGLLPISHFKWEEVEQSGSQSYIPCKTYHANSFCIALEIKPQLLPTFAALAGNDYVKLKRMESPIDWVQFDPSEKPSHLKGLLCWLKGFNEPQEALEAAVRLMRGVSIERKAKVLQSLSLGMDEYQVPPSSLTKFFIHGMPPPFLAVEKEPGLIPDWMRLPLTQARLTADVLDVLQLQRMSLSLPVAHRDMPSSNLMSRPLRQVMYGLLLGGGKPIQVEESDRDGLQLKLIPVEPAFRGVTQRLVLSSLDKAELSERLQVLLEALQVTESSLRNLPPQLRLPVAVTCFWLQRAEPPPDNRLLKVLLLGLSIGDSLRHRAALQVGNQPKLDLNVAHAFNQWQACLKDSIHLNQLLGFPLPEPQVARLYEGTLVHNIVHRMRTGRRFKAFLKSDRSSVKRYHAMVSVVHQFHTQRAPSLSKTLKKAAPSRCLRQPLEDLTPILQQLFLQDQDEEKEVSSVVRAQEDLYFDEPLLVKTRYRTKERNNRCNKPELSRKEECRGRDII
ncbi:protein asteroid homolog 1 [Lates calcarifer]|uniref:Protein asteroid homolog 1 n=1 Tax=Lates calcarifer TaxID=8187 RepID=A0AAJ7LQK9_LATCA|nr:protein asteroid homolog 1 [Lates calcarifer]